MRTSLCMSWRSRSSCKSLTLCADMSDSKCLSNHYIPKKFFDRGVLTSKNSRSAFAFVSAYLSNLSAWPFCDGRLTAHQRFKPPFHIQHAASHGTRGVLHFPSQSRAPFALLLPRPAQARWNESMRDKKRHREGVTGEKERVR